MDSQSQLDSACQIVDYYQRLANSEDGARWKLGLFMAKYWVTLLEADLKDNEKLELFIQTLEAEKLNQGSGWLDLLLQVRNGLNISQ